jgi:hypothetical protein
MGRSNATKCKSLPGRAALPLLAFLLLAAVPCAFAQKPPKWVGTTPPPDRNNTYFTGSASGLDAGTATANATNNLIAGIMQYIGVTVKVNTSSTVKASVDAYSEELRQTVEAQSVNRLTGFKVMERFVQADKKSGTVTVHILASYLTKDLEREKARIEALFKEQADAVARPEGEGDALAAENKSLEAAVRYIEAMSAAAGSDIDNASIKFERNANKARAQLANLAFVLPGGKNLAGSLDKAPSSPLEIQLVSGNIGNSIPVAGARVSVGYPRKLPNGKLGTRTESFVTDAQGMVRVQLPAPDFTGKGRVSIQLDLSSAMELLDRVPASFSSIVSAVEDEVRSRVTYVDYSVTSRAAAIPMAVFLVDLDERGSVNPAQATQGGLMDTLMKEGFAVQNLNLDPAAIFMQDDQLVALARTKASPGTLRFAFGSGRIVSVRKDGSMFIAQAGGTVKVVDLAAGQLLYSGEKSWQALGPDEASARRNALKELGAQVLGKDLAASLP